MGFGAAGQLWARIELGGLLRHMLAAATCAWEIPRLAGEEVTFGMRDRLYYCFLPVTPVR